MAPGAKNHDFECFGGSQTALEGSDRSHMATGPITHGYYKLGASVCHPDNLCCENSDFLVVEVTYKGADILFSDL